MRNVEIRADGSRWVISYGGVDYLAENFKWVPFVIGSIVGSLDGVSVNGIPLDKWVLMW